MGDQLLRYRGRRAVAAEIACQAAAGAQGPAHRLLDPLRRPRLSNVLQEQSRRADYRNGVRQAFAREVRRAAVDSLEHGIAATDVGARHKPEPAHQPRTKIADDIAE